MTLINVEGDVGSGKTIFIVERMCRNLAFEKPKAIYANFEELELPHTILKPEMLNTLTDAFIALDEAYTWLESRGSGGKKLNIFLSYILFQSRKKNVDFYLSDQMLSSIDSRFRFMCNWQVDCEALDNGFSYSITRQSRYREYKPVKLFFSFEKAEKYFGLYNTYRIVDSIDKNMLIDITQDKTNILAEVDIHVNKILDSYSDNVSKITKGVVTYYVMQNNLPSRYIDFIYSGIKGVSLKNKGIS